MTPKRYDISTLTLIMVYVGLMALLALTLLAASMPLGHFGLLVALAIAGGKALLVVLYFMHVRHSPPVTKIFAASGFLWLAILFALTLTEYLTR